jgi:ATP-dependent DNA helicase RecQ
LQYFGEEAEATCGNCDTCMAPPELWDATVDAQKILSTIYRTNQTFGAGHIIEVLRGSKNSKIINKNHHLLSVYGIGKDRPKEHWNTILRQLLNLNYLMIKNWEYKSLGLTSKSQEILTGAIKLNLRKQEFAFEKITKVKKEKKLTRTNDAIHEKQDLLNSLKELRNKMAKQKNIPSYIIFNDKSLHDMCALMPRNNSEFLLVHGVGQSKLENYGKNFLEVLKQY